MTAKRIINIVVLTVWTITQMSMMFIHVANSDHTAKAHAAAAQHLHADHTAMQAFAADETQGDPGSSHSDMTGQECCGTTCTVDVLHAVCPLGTAQDMRLFNGAKVAALTAAELGSPNPPPNTTI